jgi:hypothetical protein
MIRIDENQAQGPRNNKNKSELDKTKHNQRQSKKETAEAVVKLANTQAPRRQHYIQSRKAVSAPGSTCRPKALASKVTAERSEQ